SQSLDESHIQKVDIHQETINILSSIAALAIDKDIEISFDGPSEPVMVSGYSPAIQILLRNLIDNAIRYTPNKGEVSVKLTQLDDGVKVIVEDTGPGIPQEQQEGIYQRFRRGEDINNTQGSGLGLAIVKRIIELHSATIEMQNRKESGLRISVLFPKNSNQ
ncbi:MAG: sensor histidine kinase, partial [Candidatus Thiodiazotropha sp. 6PLUC9]